MNTESTRTPEREHRTCRVIRRDVAGYLRVQGMDRLDRLLTGEELEVVACQIGRPIASLSSLPWRDTGELLPDLAERIHALEPSAEPEEKDVRAMLERVHGRIRHAVALLA